MPVNASGSTLITNNDYVQVITSQTKEQQKLNILLVDVGHAIEKSQTGPREAYIYLNEDVSDDWSMNRFQRIEDAIKTLRNPFSAATARLAENYVNVLGNLYEAKVISGVEAQSHLIKLLPEVFTGWNEPLSECFAKLLVDSLDNDPDATQGLIDKLNEKMPDATNEMIYLQKRCLLIGEYQR